MFTKKRIERNTGTIKPQNRLLKMLKLDILFQRPPINLDKKEPSYNQHQKEIRNAMLEAEYNKAIITAEQNRRFC